MTTRGATRATIPATTRATIPATTPETIPATTPGTTAESAAVELTLGPVSLERFREEHLEMRPLVVPRGDPGRFDAILSAADVDRMVGEGGLRVPAFRLVRDGDQLPLR